MAISIDALAEFTGLLDDDDLLHLILSSGSGRKNRKVKVSTLRRALDRPRYIDASAPDVNDDSTAGVEVGNRWLDTTGPTLYMCTDASEGAAVWSEMNDWSSA